MTQLLLSKFQNLLPVLVRSTVLCYIPDGASICDRTSHRVAKLSGLFGQYHGFCSKSDSIEKDLSDDAVWNYMLAKGNADGESGPKTELLSFGYELSRETLGLSPQPRIHSGTSFQAFFSQYAEDAPNDPVTLTLTVPAKEVADDGLTPEHKATLAEIAAAFEETHHSTDFFRRVMVEQHRCEADPLRAFTLRAPGGDSYGEAESICVPLVQEAVALTGGYSGLLTARSPFYSLALLLSPGDLLQWSNANLAFYEKYLWAESNLTKGSLCFVDQPTYVLEFKATGIQVLFHFVPAWATLFNFFLHILRPSLLGQGCFIPRRTTVVQGFSFMEDFHYSNAKEGLSLFFIYLNGHLWRHETYLLGQNEPLTAWTAANSVASSNALFPLWLQALDRRSIHPNQKSVPYFQHEWPVWLRVQAEHWGLALTASSLAHRYPRVE